MRTILLFLASTLLLAPLLANATGCEMTTSRPEVDTTATPVGRFYIDNDPCQPCGIILSPWIYEESNGIEGLQRADEVMDDTCGGRAGPGDTIIF